MSIDILSLAPPIADERIPYGSDPLQFGDLRLPDGDGPHPVVVYVHGGFWRAQYDLVHAGHPCTALTAMGYATWNVEYRRLGNGGGWPVTFEDVAAAAEYVTALARHYPLDLDRVVAAGHSAGGHLALWLAGRHRIDPRSPLYRQQPLALRGAVSIAGVCDLRRCWKLRLGGGVVRDLMGGRPEDVPDRYAAGSPAALLPLGAAQALVHGTNDDSVPYEMSARYRADALAAGDAVALVTLRDTGHFEPVDPRSAAWPHTAGAITGLLEVRT